MKTTTELPETMRLATQDLAPSDPAAMVKLARTLGRRRRLQRHAAVGLSTTAVLGAVVTTALLATNGASDPGRPAPFAASPGDASSATTYAPGSETEVPGGPEVPTDRSIVADDTLVQVTRDLIPGGSTISVVSVDHVTGSGVGQHMADRTTDGRAMSFQVDGAGAWIAVGRWDGYHAVGFADLGTDVVDGGLADALGRPLEQRAATSAREACGGSFRSVPATVCTQVPEGWYSVARPNAGGAPGSQELWVDLFTEDGYVVRVHSLNTAAEKQGLPLRSTTAISEQDSVRIARSPRWFTTN